MSKLTNKIEAHDRTVSMVLENKKYTVDYFQREYNLWTAARKWWERGELKILWWRAENLATWSVNSG